MGSAPGKQKPRSAGPARLEGDGSWRTASRRRTLAGVPPYQSDLYMAAARGFQVAGAILCVPCRGS